MDMNGTALKGLQLPKRGRYISSNKPILNDSRSKERHDTHAANIQTVLPHPRVLNGRPYVKVKASIALFGLLPFMLTPLYLQPCFSHVK